MEIRSKWREFEVSVVGGLDAPFVIDESQRRILIRRNWLMPWRMLWTLVDAMNASSALDEAWANRLNGKNTITAEVVMIAGEAWQVLGCAVLANIDKSGEVINLNPYRVDHEHRKIYVNARMNLAAAGAALVNVVNSIYADKVLEFTERVENVVDSFMNGKVPTA